MQLILDDTVMLQALALLQLVTLLLFIILFVSLSRTKKKLRRMLKGTKLDNLEDVIMHNQERILANQKEMSSIQSEINKIHANMGQMKGKIGIVRYNAFDTHGNDLSYSIAILNEEQTGIVLTGLYNRDNTFMYAKPITKGESSYTLSPEEKNAIKKAIE